MNPVAFLCAMTDGFLVTASPEHMLLQQVKRSTDENQTGPLGLVKLCLQLYKQYIISLHIKESREEKKGHTLQAFQEFKFCETAVIL